MAKSKKVVRVTTTREEEEKSNNPIPKLIRAYLVDGEEYNEELRQYQYVINVQRYNSKGIAVTVTGHVYEDLEALPTQLGERFGSSRFRLFIKAIDGEGKTAGIAKILDYEIEFGGDDTDVEEVLSEESTNTPMLQLQLQREQQAHELRIKEMDNQKEMMIAAFNAKSGGGLKATDMIQLVKLGASFAGGAPLDGNEENPFLEIIKAALPAVLPAMLQKQNPQAQPAQPAPDDTVEPQVTDP